MKPTILLTLTAMVLGCWSTATARLIQRPRVGQVKIDSGKSKVLAIRTRQLMDAEIPAYGVLYRTTGKTKAQGAMLVASVRKGPTLDRWADKIGAKTIGFQTSAAPNDTGGSSGYVRVGRKWFNWDDINSGYGGPRDIKEKSSTYTEATFHASTKVIASFTGFYMARIKRLIKDSKGKPIKPYFQEHGRSTVRDHESCAGAASSGLNTGWIAAFKRNIPALKKYGQENNIPELKNIPDNAADLMMAFVKKNNLKQQTDPRVMVRTQAPGAAMLTVFNAVQGDPIKNLTWNRTPRWYVKPSWSNHPGQRVRDKNNPTWTGLGTPYTILDNPNNVKAKSFVSERLPLGDFATTLQ